MRKFLQRVVISFLAVFMLISGSGMAVFAEGSRAEGRDVSEYFDAEMKGLTVNDNVFYDSAVSNFEPPKDYESAYGAKLSFDFDWIQNDKEIDTFREGDYLILDLFTIKGDQVLSLGQISPEIYLNYNNVQIGTGAVVTKMSDDKKEVKIQYKIVFNDKVLDINHLHGSCNGSFFINKGETLTNIKGIIDDDHEFDFVINPTFSEPNYARPGMLEARNYKKGNSYNIEDNKATKIRWEIEAFSFLEQGIQDYRSGKEIDYDSVIFEEVLDENQYFVDNLSGEMSDNTARSVTFGFPIVMNTLKGDESFIMGDADRILRHGRVAFLSFSLKNLENSGLIKRVTDGDDASRKAEVLSDVGGPKWTVITEDGVQKLFVNFGKPGGELLNYKTLLENNGLNYELFGENGKVELNSLDRLIQDLEDEKAYYTSLLGSDHDDCDGNCYIDNGVGVTDQKCSYWKKYIKMLEDTISYYNSNPGVYGFRVYLDTYVTEEAVHDRSVTSVKNTYKIHCGQEIATADATFQAKWNGDFYGDLRDGDVQLFKYDGRYTNDPIKNKDSSMRQGGLEGVQFEVYKSSDVNGSNPIHFNYDSQTDKYTYDASGALTQLETNEEGLISISGLARDNYYFKEISDIDGYYTEQNQKVDFAIENDKVVFAYVENAPREVELFKHNKDNEALQGATFEVYKKDESQALGFVKEEIDGKTYYRYDSNGTKELTVDSDGKLYLSHLDEGKYYFKETKAPDGYKQSDETWAFEISKSEIPSSPQVVKVENERFSGEVNVTKVDSQSDDLLEGAQFILAKEVEKSGNTERKYYAIENGSIKWVNQVENAYTFTTDDDGEFSIDKLEIDTKYILIETKAPDGYSVLTDEAEKEFTLNTDGQVVNLTIKNTKMPTNPSLPMPEVEPVSSLVATKVDDKTGEGLKGAEFIVARKQGGFLIFPAKYVYYALDNNGLVTWVENEVDAKVFTSTSNGNVVVEDLPRDQDYVLIESKAPEGYYVLDDDKETEFTVEEDQSLAECIIENTKLPNNPDIPMPGMPELGQVEMTKVDSKDHSIVLSNAQFVVARDDNGVREYYSLNNDGIVEWVEDIQNAKIFNTDKNGQCIVGQLELGKTYIFIETGAPEGYILPTNNETTVEIKDYLNSMTIENTVDDGEVLGENHQNSDDKAKTELSKETSEVLGENYVKTSDDTHLIEIIVLMVMSMMVAVVIKKDVFNHHS